MRKYIVDGGWRVLFNDVNLSMQDVLRYAQLPLDLLSRKSPTISGDQYFRLWDGLAYAMRNEPTFPLRMAEAISVEAFSPPLFACLCSADLNMALERLAKYKPLVGPLRLEVEKDEERTKLAFRGLPENDRLPGSLIAFELAFWVQIARIATRERIIPEAIHVTVELPERARYEEYFGARLKQDEFNGLTFSAIDAGKPFLTANRQMWSIFEPELKKRLEDLGKDSPFRNRVRACLIEILASGHYSMADVASKLAISTRTLQRRLNQENTGFQKELDSLREELARHYLSNSDYSSNQIAFLLGYEEPTSFFRAFRTWTGQTPDYIRANAR